MKIVILDGYAANPGDLDYHLLEQLGEVVVYPRTSDAEHPYATATAIINDGTEFHEPAPSKTTYTNVVGEARNAKIAETGDEWKEFTIPFTYDAFAQYGAKAKSVLVTLSTNADAGQGSDGDLLYVDDLSFVYNAGLKAITLTAENGEVFTVDGVNSETKEYTATVPFDVTANNLKAISDGKGAYVSTTIADGKATFEITMNCQKIYKPFMSATERFTSR